MNLSFRSIFYSLFLLFCFLAFAVAEGKQKKSINKTYKTSSEPSYTKLNINDISTWIKNNGETDLHPTHNPGFVYPKESGKTIVFQSGFLWAGKIKDEIRAGGSMYDQGQSPGRILDNGKAENLSLPHVRIYRVRRDYLVGDLNMEANDEGKTVEEVFEQYQKDWNEWPSEFGAPFEDINKNGIYEPTIDIPGERGADQTVWFVSNDLHEEVSKELYGSLPMEMEIQTTAWGYRNDNILRNIIFRKYILINKSQSSITDMYVSMWSDVDIGYAGDDFVGCDTLLNTSYSYNANEVDIDYGNPPPSVGFSLVQGPIVNAFEGDTAKFKNRKIPFKKNLGMTSFAPIIDASNIYNNPSSPLGIYRVMQGTSEANGEPFINPLTGEKTKFVFSGYPESQTGWLGDYPFDLRMIMSSGPFEIAVGDTQEIIFAEVAALGVDRLESIRILRYYISEIENRTKDLVTITKLEVIPNEFGLSQNYPNPFNLSTKVRFASPVEGIVNLSIFNALGQKIREELNQFFDKGEYEHRINASNFASGIYLYRLSVNGISIDTKKMILLK